jgi:tetratricopeptide (TPR) repeat protein
MSLIIDALKRAQQLRSDGAEGPPILKVPYPKKKRGRRFKKQWIPIGAGLISLCILLFVFFRPASSPLATQTNGAIAPMERKHSATVPEKEEPTEGLHYVGAALSGRPSSVSVAEKISSEPPKEVLSLPKDEDSLPTDQALKRAGSGQAPNRPGTGQAGTQAPPNAGAAFSDRPSHPQRETKSADTKTSFNKTSFNEKRKESLTKQAPPPLPLTAQKEEAPLKSIGVQQEGGKEGTLASDVLNHFNSGVTFYNQKEFSKAIQAYQKVIELDPTYVEAYNNLGIIYQMMGDVDRAFGAYQKATEINPRYEKGYNNLGILLLLKGRYEEALEVFQKALGINPNNIESHINLGILFKKKGQWDEAIESYQKALAIEPLHRETHYNIALLYEQLENLELAISHYQQFIRLSSKSHSELVSRVQSHLNTIMKARGDK